MREARCSCGGLRVQVSGAPRAVVACHCTSCQRRTGAPFGVGAFHPADQVRVAGTEREYVRAGASGGDVRSRFCPNCGSTVYWTADKAPGLIGIAVGAFAEPEDHPPALSVWERSRHPWAHVDAGLHLAQGSPRLPESED